MKLQITHNSFLFCVMAVLLGSPDVIAATLGVTAITTMDDTSALDSAESGANPTTITYNNDIRAITGLTAKVGAVTSNYAISGAADQVFVRRNAVSANQSSIWSATGANATTVKGTDVDDFAAMMNANNLFTGTDNLFVNSPAAANAGNIERMDLVNSSGLRVNSTDGILVFDRGAAGGHDSFKVAVITSLGSGINNPLTWLFTSSILVNSADYGLSNPQGDFGYTIGRFSAGDDISSHVAMNETGTQGIGGVVVPMLDFGITNGTTIFGYVLMGIDVTGALANWSTAANYPTTTTASNGGLDAVAVNGRIIKVIPEATTSGLVLLTSALLTLRKRRRKIAH